ncbi:hypothetical protein RIR_jg36034.t1 [Rhizophagus irregularis DAOM 181602=DAOM 197198]|nr:hypothetical protein RIR_jg36034.t1 [Rhizophagus irregularis DAOM 181602=DAOM 197198]
MHVTIFLLTPETFIRLIIFFNNLSGYNIGSSIDLSKYEIENNDDDDSNSSSEDEPKPKSKKSTKKRKK